MPHIDDGTLHALIDGALRADEPARADEARRHLAACEDCRARLDQAARLRDDASRILADATPADAIDAAAAADFDDVLARAETRAEAGGTPADTARPATGRRRGVRRRAGVRRQLGWTRRAAWAATLVLALGTGYLLRDMIGPDGSPTIQRSADRPAPEAFEAGDPEAPSPDPSRADATDPDVDATDADVDAVAPEPGLEERPTPATPTADAPPEPQPSPSAAPDPTPAPPARAVEELAEGLRMTGEAAGAGAIVVAGEADAPAEVSEAARWTAATVDEARAALEGPLYVLPRATLLEVYTDETGDAPAVLSLQRLESGVPVRVVQRRPPADAVEAPEPEPAAAARRADASPTADAPAAALPGTETARVTRDEFELVLEATLPAELLTILAEAARPAP